MRRWRLACSRRGVKGILFLYAKILFSIKNIDEARGKMRRARNFMELPSGGRKGFKIEGRQPVAGEAVNRDFHAPRRLT
jgi:hypothetical protein